MRIQDLLEAPQIELAMSHEAHQAALQVMRYVFAGHPPRAHVDIGSHGEFYVYGSQDIGLEQSFALLIGRRKAATLGMSGAIMHFEGEQLFGYRVGLVIYCLNQFNDQALRQTVNSVGFMHTFEHEYIHLLDNARTDDRIVGGERSDPRTSQADYFNDPAENNAYFHDIAKDILHVINAGAEAPQYFQLYKFTGDWQTDLARLLTKDPYAKRFVQLLRKQRRRSLMKRLYRLYQQMLQTVQTASTNAK
jgi:hypothetical protein